METFIKVSIYSAIITIAFLQSTTSFAQSWEPENAWDEHDSWETATSPQKPSHKTPSSASANTQNNDDDNWDAATSTPKTSSANDSWDATPSSSNSHSSFSQSSSTRPTYTDNAIENSKFVIRVGGGFTYLYYGSIGATKGSKHRAFHYPGANGNLAFNYCINSHCIGVDQILATVYTYKGSGNHFLGSTHINYINRKLLTDRFMLEFGAGGGVTYASNSNYKEKRVFAGNGLALSLKLYFLCTFFITKNIGIGLNASPIGLFEFGLSNHPDANNIKHLPISIGVDAGLHVMFKY